MKNDITLLPLEKKSEEYADRKLQLIDPELWQTNCSRYRKMSLDIMDGSDVEEAFGDGGLYVIHAILESQGTLADVEEEYGEGGVQLWLHILGVLRALED